MSLLGFSDSRNSNCAEIHLGKKPGNLTLLKKQPNELLVSPITENLCGISVWFDQDNTRNSLRLKMESGKFAARDYIQNFKLSPNQNNFFYIPRTARTKIAYSLVLKTEGKKSIIIKHEIISQ